LTSTGHTIGRVGRAARTALAAWIGASAIAGASAGQLIEPPSPRQEGEAWALIVAIDDYPDERVAVTRGAVASARSVAGLLTHRYGFAASRIIELYDRDASGGRINEALRRLNLQMDHNDSLFVVLGLASFDSKDQAPFLVPYDGHPGAPWTLLPVPQLASTLSDLPADPLLAVFKGCASRWDYLLRQARGADHRQSNAPDSRPFRGSPPVKVAPGALASREFITLCAGTSSGVRESQVALVLQWLQARTTPGERRPGRELQKALANPLWSVETTAYGQGPGYGFVPSAGPSEDLEIVTDRKRSAEERGEAIERVGRLYSLRQEPADATGAVAALRAVAESAAEGTALQQRAALALGQIRTEESARVLTRLATEDPSPELALTAVRALGASPPALARPALELVLGANRPAVQRAALRALVSLRSRESLPRIVSLLRASSDSQVRLACLDALQVLGPDGTDVVPTLVAIAREETDEEVSAAALRVLTQTGDAGRADVICERLAARSPVVRRAAAYALGDLPPSEPVTAALMRALGDADPRVREAAASVLGRTKVPQARDALIEAMKDQAPQVRVAAAAALGRLGDHAAVPSLRTALGSQSVDERRAAACALGLLGAVETFSELVRTATSDEAAAVRDTAESALEAMFEATRFKGARAEPALQDPSPEVRVAALGWLSRSGNPAWLGLFRTALASDNDKVRAAALDGLTELASEPAIAILEEEARRPEPARRGPAVQALAGIGTAPALAALLDLCEPNAPAVDPGVLEALGGFDDERAIDRAKAFLDAPTPTLRLAAAGALQRQALALHGRGDPKRGVELGERALQVRQSLLGETHPDIATDLNNLGVMYLDLGQLETARERLSRALELRRQTERPDPGLATTLVNLGVIARRSGDFKQALDYFFRALDMRQYLFGKDSLEATATLDNIAEAFEKIGDAKQAAAYRQQAEFNRKQRRPPPAASMD
jgi:HEAT repeat protein